MRFIYGGRVSAVRWNRGAHGAQGLVLVLAIPQAKRHA